MVPECTYICKVEVSKLSLTIPIFFYSFVTTRMFKLYEIDKQQSENYIIIHSVIWYLVLGKVVFIPQYAFECNTLGIGIFSNFEAFEKRLGFRHDFRILCESRFGPIWPSPFGWVWRLCVLSWWYRSFIFLNLGRFFFISQ